MTISSIDVVIYTVYFLIPGFITAEIKNTIIPGKRRSEAEKTLVYLGYSVFNFGCWFWAIQLINNRFVNKTPLYWARNPPSWISHNKSVKMEQLLLSKEALVLHEPYLQQHYDF